MAKVIYGIQDFGEPPPVVRAAGAGRTSPFDPLLNEIMAEYEGVWKVIAQYEVSDSASSAATQLRKQYGNKPDVMGWEFRTGKLRADAYGLWAKFEGSLIVDGREAEWEQEKEARKAAWHAARDAKEGGKEKKGLLRNVQKAAV